LEGGKEVLPLASGLFGQLRLLNLIAIDFEKGEEKE
jgi:hypothetical protein